MIDIACLACAVVHCDVVVTEKQWVHEMGRSGLLELHNTVALNDTADLPQTLVAMIRMTESEALRSAVLIALPWGRLLHRLPRQPRR